MSIKGTFETASQRWVLPADLRGQRFVDLGCNTGAFVFMAESRGAEAWGLDLQKDQLEKARTIAAYTGSRAQFVHCNIMDLRTWDQFPIGFDVVFHSSVFHHLRKPKAALRLMRELVRVRMIGEFACWTPGEKRWTKADSFPEDWGAEYHVAFPTKECVMAELQGVFAEVRYLGANKTHYRMVFEARV